MIIINTTTKLIYKLIGNWYYGWTASLIRKHNQSTNLAVSTDQIWKFCFFFEKIITEENYTHRKISNDK